MGVIFVSYPNPTDNLKQAYPQHLLFLNNCSILFFLLSNVFKISDLNVLPNKSSIIRFAIASLTFMSAVIIRLYIHSAKTIKSFVLLTMIQIILLCTTLIMTSNDISYLIYFYMVFSMLGICTALSYGDFGDKNYNLGRMVVDFCLIIFAAVIFGKNVYGKTPSYLGNPSKKIEMVTFKDSIIVNTMKTSLLNNQEIIYSNQDLSFFKLNDSTVIQINNSDIKQILYHSSNKMSNSH